MNSSSIVKSFQERSYTLQEFDMFYILIDKMCINNKAINVALSVFH